MDSDMMQTRLFRLSYLAATRHRKSYQWKFSALCSDYDSMFCIWLFIKQSTHSHSILSQKRCRRKYWSFLPAAAAGWNPYTNLSVVAMSWSYDFLAFDVVIYIDLKLAKTMWNLNLKYSKSDGKRIREPQKDAQGATQIEWIISASQCVGGQEQRKNLIKFSL